MRRQPPADACLRRVAPAASCPRGRSRRWRRSPAPPRRPWRTARSRSAAARARAAPCSSPTPRRPGSRRWCDPAACGARRSGSSAAGVCSADRTSRGLRSRAPPRLRAHPAGAGAPVPAGAHRRLQRRAGAVRGARRDCSSAGSASGSTSTSTTPSARGSCARPRRSASSTIPAIRHVYDAGVVGRPGLPGRQLDRRRGAAATRCAAGPRPIPAVLALARDLLGALEHAHLQGIIVRRIVAAVGPGQRRRAGDRHRPSLLQLLPAGDPARHAAARRRPSWRPRCATGRRGDPASRRLHRRGAALLRRHRAGAAARPAAGPAGRPSSGRPVPRAIERIVLRALRARAGRPLPHRGGDAGGLRLRRRHLRDPAVAVGLRDRSSGSEDRGPLGEAAPPGPGRRLRAARRCWARADSAGCTGCGISTWSARSRSRCCTRR